MGDKVTRSAIVNNNTDRELKVGVSLNVNRAKGLRIESANHDKTGVYGTFINVPANGEVRLDWPATVVEAGQAIINVVAKADKIGDAMEKPYMIFEHGIEKFLTTSGKAPGNDITVKLDLPKARKQESTSLIVQVTPSLAVTMLDALHYLID